MLSERAPICNHNVCLFCLHRVSDCADSALNEAAGAMSAAVFGLSAMSGMWLCDCVECTHWWAALWSHSHNQWRMSVSALKGRGMYVALGMVRQCSWNWWCSRKCLLPYMTGIWNDLAYWKLQLVQSAHLQHHNFMVGWLGKWLHPSQWYKLLNWSTRAKVLT